MSVTASVWQTDLYTIIAHPTEPRVLLLPGDDGWTLPHVRLNKRLWTPEVEPVSLALRQRFDLDCIVLRCSWVKIDREAQHLSAVYVLELRDRGWTPPEEARWFGRESLPDLVLAAPDLRDALLEYFDDSNSALRPAWARPGWFATAELWLREQLNQRGYEIVAPIEQVKTCGISCILRSRATTGDLYFKVASRRPLFATEPPLMATLAEEHPAYVPPPLAIEPEQGWMLLADVGPDLRQTPTLSAWKIALQAHSQIQQSYVGRADDVLAMGALDRRLERLAAQSIALLNNSAALARLNEQELQEAQALAPRVAQMCRDLASYNIPETLVHGDLHGGNIALRDDRYLFFDWTDSCLAHPFFDLVTMLEDAGEFLKLESSDELRDTYLAQWTSYAPIERLREAWASAEPLGALHQAVSYYHIVESMEPTGRHEFAGGLPYWIRRALSSAARSA